MAYGVTLRSPSYFCFGTYILVLNKFHFYFVVTVVSGGLLGSVVECALRIQNGHLF